jgi:hypothetical protein
MLNDLTPHQLELAEYMSYLSELAYCAGWTDGLEFALWKMVIDGPYQYGQFRFSHEHKETLVELSSACNGWIMFRDQLGETFVPIDQWLEIFSEASRRPSA